MVQTASHHWYIQLYTDLDFLFFWIIVSCDLCFYFLFFETFTQPFCKRHYPAIVITKTRHVLCTGTCNRTCLYIIEIIKAWPLYVLWTRRSAYLLARLYKIKTFGWWFLNKKRFKNLYSLWNWRKTKKKVSYCGIEPACITKTLCAWSGTVQRQTHWATLSSVSRSVITCTVQVNRTSWLRQNKDEKFCKIKADLSSYKPPPFLF